MAGERGDSAVSGIFICKARFRALSPCTLPAGPLSLPAWAPDLTVISQRNRGKFPYQRIKRTIDGKEPGPLAHGDREMLIWGPIFHEVEADQDWGEVRLDAITKYMESIQHKWRDPDPDVLVRGGAYLLWLVTNRHLPCLLMVRYLSEQPHRHQSSRRIHFFRRNRRRDRGGPVCISGIVE